MGTSRALVAALAAGAAVTVVLAGCGAAKRPARSAASPLGAFAWLRPERRPGGWLVARIPAGAGLAYPPSWRRIKSDPGTATSAELGEDHRFTGYLNLTPRQASESLADWDRFRIEHNADEGERNVTVLGSGTGLRFTAARGSCVRDAYTTSTGARYIEIACLVAGRHADVVVVGASPPGAWRRMSPVLERAIASVVT
jgi:hypothetical protein